MTTWNIDTTHSTIGFSVRHMVVAKVRGRFAKFAGAAELEGTDLATARGQVTIEVASLDTGVGDRDGHLRSPDFFDAEGHPSITFVATKVEKGEGDAYRLHGDLTIRGTTRAQSFEVEFGGHTKDPWGNERIGLGARTSLSRKDFGLTWNQLLETGGAVVGDRIDVEVECELVKAG